MRLPFLVCGARHADAVMRRARLPSGPMEREASAPPIRVVVAAPFGQIVGIHRRAAEYADEIELCGAISDASRVVEQVRRLQPDVVVLSSDLGIDDSDLLAQLTTTAPSTRLVTVADTAHRGFADATVANDATAYELRSAIVAAARRVDAAAAPPAHGRADAPGDDGVEADDPAWFAAMHGTAAATAETHPGDVAGRSVATFALPETSAPDATAAQVNPRPPAAKIAVFSGKGGVGTSSLAVNLATALAAGRRVALVDLDLQFGDIGMLLRLEAHPTSFDSLAAIIPGGEPLDDTIVAAALARTPSSLDVLLAPRSPDRSDLVTPASVRTILAALAKTHDYVVVDTPAHIDERVYAALEAADRIVLVVAPLLASVKDARLTMRLLQSLGVEPERVAVVLNETRARPALAAGEVERALRFPLLAQLPFDTAVDVAAETGVPMVQAQPRSRFADAVTALAAALAGVDPPAPAASRRRWPRRDAGAR